MTFMSPCELRTQCAPAPRRCREATENVRRRRSLLRRGAALRGVAVRENSRNTKIFPRMREQSRVEHDAVNSKAQDDRPSYVAWSPVSGRCVAVACPKRRGRGQPEPSGHRSSRGGQGCCRGANCGGERTKGTVRSAGRSVE